MLHQLFDMISRVGRIGHQYLEIWVSGVAAVNRRPNLVAVFLFIIDGRKPQSCKILNDGSIAVIWIIDAKTVIVTLFLWSIGP
jgi:hypothetical protein